MATVNSIKCYYGKTSRNLSAKLLLIWVETLYFFFLTENRDVGASHVYSSASQGLFVGVTVWSI